MTTEKLKINSDGTGMDLAMDRVEQFAESANAVNRDAHHLRLITEEMMELLRSLDSNVEASFWMEEEKHICSLHLSSETRQLSKDSVGVAIENSGNISGKLMFLLEYGYAGVDARAKRLEKIGIRKADTHIIREMGEKKAREAYVWSLEAYGLTAFDALAEDDEDNWLEIGSSIIANLSDDVQVFIFRDRIEMITVKALQKKGKEQSSAYAISPEFDSLKKIPVPKSRFQVRIVQLLYGRLESKQSSDSKVQIEKTLMPSKSAPSGKINTLIYSGIDTDPTEDLPCVLFLHGGAFLFPAMPYHYRLASLIAQNVRCRVILPMYDLAPDYVPPMQQEEAFDIYNNLIKHPIWYHIDPDRIAVIGDSAGGTLVAALTLMLKERKIRMPRVQAMFYPSLDDKLASESMKKYTDVPVINADAIHEYYKMCRHEEYTANRVYISPLDADSLEGLPDAYIETAEFDALHDDGIAYARRLEEAGVKVTLNETRGTVHAFDMAVKSSILSRTINKRIHFLRMAME